MANALLTALFFFAAVCFADEDVKPLCFDFSKPVNEPLSRPIPLLKGEDNFESGLKPFDVHWSAARATVPLSVKQISDWLLDHTHWKDTSKTKLTLEKEPSPHFFELHRLKVDANVFAFIWIDWVEMWAYRVVKGTVKNPQTLLVSYQKTEGTGHITRLCGSVFVKSLGPKKSDVFLYEEAKANRYESDNIRSLHVANLFHLRHLEPAK